MNFNDIFKNNFIDVVNTPQIMEIVISLILSIVIGTYIYYFYKKTYKGIMFSKMFSTALIGMTVITTFIILAVTSNVVLSLGMVGALSIVRFRSSIKEPVDIVYIFWAISEGIVIGSQQYMLSVIGTICISVALIVFGSCKEKMNRYILVVRYNGDSKDIVNKIKTFVNRYELKSNTSYKDENKELIAEVMIEKRAEELVSELNKNELITMVSMSKYNGEYIIE